MHRADCLPKRCAGLPRIAVSILLTCAALQHLHAAEVTFRWDYAASGAAGFVLYCGQSSGSYSIREDVGNTTTHTSGSLLAGGTYYCAVTAYDPGNAESRFSNQVSVSVPAGPPVTSFTMSPMSGVAPLNVAFNNTTTGTVTGWSWDFGDNSFSTAKSPANVYSQPGTYTVKLTATGPGGSVTKTLINAIQATSPTGASGLVAAYGFEEGAGSKVADASGRGNHGITRDAKWAAQGRFGKALSFNGTSSWVTVNDSASLDLTIGMTLQAWVFPTVALSGWPDIIIKEQPAGATYYLSASGNTSTPVTGVFTAVINRLQAPARLPANTWTHVAATYDGLNQRLYVNGKQVASRAQSGALKVSANPLRIGGNSIWGDYFRGMIDEIRIHNRALSELEIQANMMSAVAPAR
jgi:PKD repeat protein